MNVRFVVWMGTMAALWLGPGVPAQAPEATAAGVGATEFTVFAFAATVRDGVVSGGVLVDQFAEGCCGSFLVAGPATCLSSAAGHATVGIRIDVARGNAAGREGQTFYIDVQDVGPAAGDLWTNSGYLPLADDGACGFGQPSTIPVLAGDILVSG